MIEDLPPEAKGSVYTGLAIMALAILRKIGLRASKDLITISADDADRDAFTRLKTRVEELDGRLGELESARNHMFGFVTRCMAYIAQCQCNGVTPPTKHELQVEYEKLIRALSDGFHAENGAEKQ